MIFFIGLCFKIVVIDTSLYEFLKNLFLEIDLDRIELLPAQTIIKLYF